MAPDPQLSDIDGDALDALCSGRHGDPFALLGPHQVLDHRAGGKPEATRWVVRALLPGASAATLLLADDASQPMQRHAQSALYEAALPRPGAYQIAIDWPDGPQQVIEDPYRFGLLLSDLDLHLLAAGRQRELASCLGANALSIDGVDGVRFAVWAPNAQRVSVVGDFNGWNGLRHPMRLRHAAGVWELFLPGVRPGACYKFELLDAHGALLPQKADPLARATELPPATASRVASAMPHRFHDQAWIAERAGTDWQRAPLSVYEMHVGSWLNSANHPEHGWSRLGDKLIPYVKQMGFTHIELMPIMEYPFGGSWGYQPLALFAPTARYGAPEEFARFVDRCHASGIGVLLDWVPAHFPTDAHGLAHFDGTSLYEYADPREGFHRDWNTYIFNFGRNEVRGLLIASALYWFEHYHIDGLRVDAVASMLYRDYSRNAGEWVPNQYGGRENLEAIAFIKELNQAVQERAPGALMIAEESTAWPGVSAPLEAGGLGFHFKWNMGWMHDTLRYMSYEPIYRAWHHNDLTFGLIYAFSEHFILPLSHDEVVYGKGALIDKMPGDDWQKFANLRAYFAFMWTHPGKKLIFMGDEIAALREWDHDGEIDWDLTDDPRHAGVQRLVGDLNHCLAAEPALYRDDGRPEGFRWVVGDDHGNSVFAYLRQAEGASPLLVVCNMTPVVRFNYRLGVPLGGRWHELLNTDASRYGGSNQGNGGAANSWPEATHGLPFSLSITLPPLATVIFKPAHAP